MNSEEFEEWKVRLFVESPIDLEEPNDDIFVEYYVYVLQHLDKVRDSFNHVMHAIDNSHPEYLDEILEKSKMENIFISLFSWWYEPYKFKLSAVKTKIFITHFSEYTDDKNFYEILHNIAESNHDYLLKDITLSMLIGHSIDLSKTPNLNLFNQHINLRDLKRSTLRVEFICMWLNNYDITPPIGLFIPYCEKSNRGIKYLCGFKYDCSASERKFIRKLADEQSYLKPQLMANFAFLQPTNYRLTHMLDIGFYFD